jgi:hypothetical protein
MISKRKQPEGISGQAMKRADRSVHYLQYCGPLCSSNPARASTSQEHRPKLSFDALFVSGQGGSGVEECRHHPGEWMELSHLQIVSYI